MAGSRQDCRDENIDMTPQAPFIRVMRSARCMARTSEKWPTSAERSVFCLSIAGWFWGDNSLEVGPLVAAEAALVRLDMADGCGSKLSRRDFSAVDSVLGCGNSRDG